MARQPCPPLRPASIPDLFTLSLEALASHPDRLTLPAVVALPEEVSLALFDRIIAKGKLTPRLVQLFEDAEQEAVMARVSAMGISKWTPPLIKDSRTGTLGQKPPWW